MKSMRATWIVLALGGIVTCGCVPAAIAGGVIVVGAGAVVLASGCDEPVGVDVWDRSASHPICDATVVAQRVVMVEDPAGNPQVDPQMRVEGSVVTFSPCYTAHLGSGTWVVTATQEGFAKATGIVTISEDHKCSEPIYHSLELSLGTDAAAPERRPGQPAPPPLAPPPASAPPATAPAATAPSAPPVAAPSSTVPTAGFPGTPPSAPTATQPPHVSAPPAATTAAPGQPAPPVSAPPTH
jgi:hypothetical protein